MIRVTIASLLFLLGSVAQAQFIVYREIKFTGQPSAAYFDSLGFKRSHGVFESSVTGGTTSVQQRLMESTAHSTKSNYQLYENRMWYDIEYLSTDAFTQGDVTAKAHAETLAKFIRWAKAAEPTLQIGLYSMTPVADPYISRRLAQRQAANDLTQGLADALDFICPSIYLYYDESKLSYSGYALPMVTEAKRLAKGKKVFVFVAPGYHNAGDHDGQYATREVWTNVLNTIKNSGADGIILFAGDGCMGAQPGNWSYIDTCGWWQATLEFMKSLNPATGSSPGAPTIVSPRADQVIDPSGWTAVWRKAAGAARYQFQLSSNSSFLSPLINDSTITDTLNGTGNLASGATYYIRVRAKGSVGWGNYSATVRFSTITAPPTIIDPQPGTKHNGSSIHARWNRISGASAYQLQVAGTGTFATPEIDDSTITDTSKYVSVANANAQYYCRVRAKTVAGWTAWSSVSDFATGASSSIDDDPEVPSSFALAQNFPNPFNPTTQIRFSIPVGVHVRMTLFNALGQEVRTLVNDNREAGYHEVRLDGSSLASGVYYYRISAGSFVATKKLMLVK